MPEKNVQVNTDRGLPYERFLQFGPENLTEAELLAVILRTGTKEDSAVRRYWHWPPIREKDCWVCMM